MNPIGESTDWDIFSLLDNGVATSSLDEIFDCFFDENIAEVLPFVVFAENKTLSAGFAPPSLYTLRRNFPDGNPF